jgi:hypothetical protein
MVDVKELERWLSREINQTLSMNRKRYDKARDEGYVSALKKVQAQLRSIEP